MHLCTRTHRHYLGITFRLILIYTLPGLMLASYATMAKLVKTMCNTTETNVSLRFEEVSH